MSAVVARDRLASALATATERLCREMTPDGYWEGYLSSSALSTATAVSALALAGRQEDHSLISAGVDWLARTQNGDGGWGDTIDSPSNLATTLLSVSALILARQYHALQQTLDNAEAYLTTHAGATPTERVAAIKRSYGADRTFAVPILMNCALAGLVPWQLIPGLPFEMAVFPASWYKALNLRVVSYALPALIAIGLLLDARHAPRNPLLRAFRRLAEKPVLGKLALLQPEHGGFLDATPLTAFVAMSLIARYGAGQPVTERCLSFLRQSMRADGSWPIDTNLSVWMTTSAVTALGHAGQLESIEREKTQRWIAARQYHAVHPFTNAAPGGWGWTHLPGGVPDADDTAGALLALIRLGERDAIPAGVRWLLQLQNSDGGWPTFCRGWGTLPFDKSSPDITAHAIRALHTADPDGQDAPSQRAIRRGLAFLRSVQQRNGSWVPLWFGNQAAEHHANPVFGTARVLLAYAELHLSGAEAAQGVQYLVSAQNPDGGWGGARGVTSSVEETALAVSALAEWTTLSEVIPALTKGVAYLTARVADGSWEKPAPIGLYFASLWYAETLYPIIWTVEALGKALKVKR